MNIQIWIKKINAYERLMRLDKPIGILLLMWPTLWGLFIAGEGRPDLKVTLIFITGVILMRSAGCVMNDIADRHYDGHVARTESRPLVTGEVTVKEALLLAAGLSISAFILVCFLNKTTILLSIVALILAVTYPLTKRFLVIPQAYLGVAFGFGIPMAFAALNNDIPLVAWWLLAANVFWAVAYDTEYAMVDREDDIKIGIKSSAIFFGEQDVKAVMLCYLCMLAIFVYIGQLLHYGYAYYTTLIIALGLVVWQYQMIKKRNKPSCFRAFLANNWIGCIIFLGLVLSYYLPNI